MRVICVNVCPLPNRHNGDLNKLEYLKEYTVVQKKDAPRGFIGYILAEVSSPNPYGFDSTRFIPLSSIDETEMIREFQTEKV